MNKIRVIYTIICVIALWPLQAQWPEAIATRYSDTYREWNFYDIENEMTGYLRPTWDFGDLQWNDWQYMVGESSGQIRKKWQNDPNIWELNADGYKYTATTQWKEDLSEWTITGNGVRLSFRLKYSNIIEEWVTIRSNSGEFYMYTATEGDLRDWVCEDNFNEDVPLHLKVFVMFMVIYHSTLLN